MHNCPGCGAEGVDREQLACKPCWFRLPDAYRKAVNAAHKRSARNPAGHRAAVQAALGWYQRNPA